MLRSSPLGKSRLATGGGAIMGLGEASWLFHAAVGSPEMLGKSSSGRSVCGSLAPLRLLAAVAAAAAAANPPAAAGGASVSASSGRSRSRSRSRSGGRAAAGLPAPVKVLGKPPGGTEGDSSSAMPGRPPGWYSRFSGSRSRPSSAIRFQSGPSPWVSLNTSPATASRALRSWRLA